MSYNMTFFPNMLGHYDQDIAALAMKVSVENSVKKGLKWSISVRPGGLICFKLKIVFESMWVAGGYDLEYV